MSASGGLYRRVLDSSTNHRFQTGLVSSVCKAFIPPAFDHDQTRPNKSKLSQKTFASAVADFYPKQLARFICAPTGTCRRTLPLASPISTVLAHYPVRSPAFSRPVSQRWMGQADTAGGGGSSSVCCLIPSHSTERDEDLLLTKTTVEGIITVLLGVACFFCLIDSPKRGTRWLDPDEIRFLELQMFIKQGGKFHEESGFKMRDLKIVLMNWRLYLQAWFLFCQSATSYGKIWRTRNAPNGKKLVILRRTQGTKFTMPTITKVMGFSTTNAQLMSAPPYVVGAISSIGFARLSDHFYWRMPFVAIPMSMLVIAYAIIISFHGALSANLGAAYFAVCLVCAGIYPIQPAAAAWNANNLAPATRRSIGVALMNAAGNCGGIVGSFMFIDKESPQYYTGFGLGLSFGATGLLVSLLLEMIYKWTNARKARMSEAEVRARYTEDELLDMGDKSPLFKHVL